MVLEGPSHSAKRISSLKIAGRQATLALSCAGQTHPDLRNHNPFQHKAVLFDEAPVAMILANKRHFQAPSTAFDCRTSALNVGSYRVWLHQQLLIVTPNTWSQELEGITPADCGWLLANSVHAKATPQPWCDETRLCVYGVKEGVRDGRGGAA